MSNKAKTPSAATPEVSIINPKPIGIKSMNNNISILNKSQLTMSSREIAELTNKEHRNVLADIRNMLEMLKIQSADFLADYKDSRGRTYKEYLLPKKYIECLLTGYSIPLRMKVIDRMHELEEAIALENHKKQIILPKHMGLAEYRKARAMELSVRALDKMFSNLPHLSEQSKQAIYADTINPIAGKNVIPLPKLEEKTYTAGEVAVMLGVSANKIGRVANELELKTNEYGITVLDKSKYSSKQVETFRYNQKAIDVIKLHLISGVAV